MHCSRGGAFASNAAMALALLAKSVTTLVHFSKSRAANGLVAQRVFLPQDAALMI